MPSSVCTVQRAELRHEQQLAVGVVEEPVAHRLCWPRTGAPPRRLCCSRARRCRRCVTMPSTKSVGTLGIGSGRQRSWFGVGGTSLNGPLRIRPRGDRTERLVRGGRPDAIRPVRAAGAARRRERRAVELLDVEAHRGLLRGVLVARQRTRHRFGGELVSEPRLIETFRGRHGASRLSPTPQGVVSAARPAVARVEADHRAAGGGRLRAWRGRAPGPPRRAMSADGKPALSL